jgi:ABC-type nitrate/sulfonate/bicarbonate transport system substrate-binding protein
MNAQGYKVENAILTAPELATEAVASGRMQFAVNSNNAMLAVEQGANVKMIIERTLNEWMVYAREGIDTCEELVGSRVAIHSPGSVSGAMLRSWVKKECPADVAAGFDPLIIEGSQNRLAALLANQIDASPVEFGDALQLDDAGGFTRLVSLAQDLPELQPQAIFGNGEWMEENPDVTKTFIRELLLQHRRINSEDGYLFELYKKYLPEETTDEALARTRTTEYAEAQLFANDGGFTEEGMAFTLDFFGPNGTGFFTSDLSVEDVADFSYLNAVLDEIGRED